MRPHAGTILKAVTKHYLSSGDFNGTSVEDIRATDTRRREILGDMVRSGTISVEFGDRHPNAFIKAFPAETAATQLKKLKTSSLQYACLYPTPRHLKSVAKRSKYEGQPFTLELALGAGQLEYRAFDLAVLERYRNDPRYYYWTEDTHGRLHIKMDSEVPASDSVVLETFGFGHDSGFRSRVVVAFLRYLTKMTPEHQRVWRTYQLKGKYVLHPVYRDIVVGNWYTGVSIFQAITEELQQINQMSGLMGRPPLFKQDYTGEAKPKKYGFLLRPTLDEFNAFVQLLEKMLSGNINVDFFKGEVDLEYLEKRKGKPDVAKPKGTVSVLKEWLAQNFKADDNEWIDKMFATFRKIIKMRQEPAHAVREDVFNQQYFRQQRELVLEAYYAVSTLRMAFHTHPSVAGHEVPEHLLKGEIWKE